MFGHTIETTDSKIIIRRICDGGISFQFKNTVEGQLLAGRKWTRLQRLENNRTVAKELLFSVPQTSEYCKQRLLEEYPELKTMMEAISDPVGTIIRKFKSQMSGVA